MLPPSSDPRVERRRAQYRKSAARKREQARHDRGDDCVRLIGAECPLDWPDSPYNKDLKVRVPERLVITLRDGRRVYYYPESRP